MNAAIHAPNKCVSSRYVDVELRGKIRPEVIPHDDQLDNDFVKDYYEGIDKETADGRIKEMLNR